MPKYFHGAVLLLILLSPASGMARTEPQSSEQLLGLWSWCKSVPKHTLDVTVSRHQNRWSLMVDGEKQGSIGTDQVAYFEMDSGDAFAVSRVSDGQLEGTWHQPRLEHYGYYAKMATKTALAGTAKDKWQGVIQVQPRPYHLFLDVFKNEQGKTQAVLRNPERNDIFGATLFDLERRGRSKSRWQLSAKRGNRKITVPLLQKKNGTITLEHDSLPKTAVLSKNSDCDPGRYCSRVLAKQSPTYRPVEQLNDGWRVADAADAGFDKAVLNNLIRKLASANPRDSAPQLLHSLLVSYQGTLVLEEYFYGHDAATVHDTRSLAKVFGSIMIGAAQQQQMDIGPNYQPLPGIYAQAELPLPSNKQQITLGHFLTYSSGLDMIENDTSQGSEGRLWRERNGEFWLYSARLKVLHQPGTRYAYASSSANMVGAAIQQVTQRSPHEFFHSAIAKPLDFSPYHWNLAPDDVPYLGGGVYVRPRDILKLGALYAANGKWNNRQIVPEQWVTLSTSPKIQVSPETTGLSEREFSNNYFGGEQAYTWLVDDIRVGERIYSSYAATGNGGQVLVVVPELQLAVGFTGGNYRMGGIWGRWRQQIIGDYLIPALN